MSYSPVEIEEAKQLAIAHGLQQVVIWHFAVGHGQHVTTWGEPMRHSLQAAEAGNHVKSAAQWPLEEALALPTSLKKMTGDHRVELVQVCAAKIDNGLAPLVAAGMVHPEIARIVLANLRTAILESSGASVQTWMELPRTAAAVRVVTEPAPVEPEPMGGA